MFISILRSSIFCFLMLSQINCRSGEPEAQERTYSIAGRILIPSNGNTLQGDIGDTAGNTTTSALTALDLNSSNSESDGPGNELGFEPIKDTRRMIAGYDTYWRDGHIPSLSEGDWENAILLTLLKPGTSALQAREELNRTMAFNPRLRTLVPEARVKIRGCYGALMCLFEINDGVYGRNDTYRLAKEVHAIALDSFRTITTDTKLYGQNTPNDPYFPQQSWYLDTLQVQGVWDLPTGLNETVVAVVDSGIVESHPDLDPAQILFTQGYDFQNFDTGAYDPGSVTLESGASGAVPLGQAYHGTFIAGIIGANRNNAIGIAGIAAQPSVKILPVRVLKADLGGNLSSTVAGIRWAAGHDLGSFDGNDIPNNSNPADVINISIGAPISNSSDADIWREAVIAPSGTAPIFITAAGNGNDPASTWFPGSLEEYITVGATNARDNFASYSNYGEAVDISAPGGSPLVASPSGSGELYSLKEIAEGPAFASSGTSFSAPIVSSLAALAHTIDPFMDQEAFLALIKANSFNPGQVCTPNNSGCEPERLNMFQPILSLQSAALNVPRIYVEESEVFFAKNLDPAEVYISVTNIGATNGDAEFEFILENNNDGLFAVTPQPFGGVPACVSNGTFYEASPKCALRVSLDRGDAELGEALLSIKGRGDALLSPEQRTRLFFNDTSLDFGKRYGRVRVRAKQVQDYNPEEDSINQLSSLVAGWTDVGEPTYTSAEQNFEFEIRELPTGRYVLEAHADSNGDGLFDSRDAYGVFPSVQNPEVIRLDIQDIYDRDFFVLGGFDPEQSGEIGSACVDDQQCLYSSSAECLREDDNTGFEWPRGYCSFNCSDGSPCPQGSTPETLECRDEFGESYDCCYCLRTCSSEASCKRDGDYACYVVDTSEQVCSQRNN